MDPIAGGTDMSNAPETISKIVALLDLLEADERQRVMNSVRAYFGDAVAEPAQIGGGEGSPPQYSDDSQVPAKAASWLKTNGLTRDELDHVFHIDDSGVDIIAEVPGKSKKEKTYNVYILSGLAAFITQGNAHFSDEGARAMCERVGCYDQANHAAHMKDIGGVVSGNKKNGWTLTQPGLKRAAALAKEIITPEK